MIGYFFVKVKKQKERLSMVPKPVIKWYDKINFYSMIYDVPADIAMSVMWVESAGDPNAVGSAGEKGLYQLKEIAIRDLEQNGYTNISDYAINPDANIRAGINFLSLQKKRAGSWPEAIKAYNQGLVGKERKPELASEYLRKVNAKRQFFG